MSGFYFCVCFLAYFQELEWSVISAELDQIYKLMLQKSLLLLCMPGPARHSRDRVQGSGSLCHLVAVWNVRSELTYLSSAPANMCLLWWTKKQNLFLERGVSSTTREIREAAENSSQTVFRCPDLWMNGWGLSLLSQAALSLGYGVEHHPSSFLLISSSRDQCFQFSLV